MEHFLCINVGIGAITEIFSKTTYLLSFGH